jgi:UDP-GlcNAc:undecaprenyl-phosphate GlcNAc-1-phosphate transferase
LADEVRLIGGVAIALTAALALVPVAIRLALRTGFMDVPFGYKGHGRPTPYLGGVAVVGAVAIAVMVTGAATWRFAPILIWAFVLFVVGTVDDRRNLHPGIRAALEAGAGAALWHYGLGWGILPGDVLNIALTILWVVGIVNAFNLMDNMDGAAPTVAAVSASGTAVLAIVGGDIALAGILLAVAAACAGFLRYNLARPARIFLGDGGSMPIGFVIAAGVMALPVQGKDLGWTTLLAVAPLVALPILDTCLVVVSRVRRRTNVLTGGRDHVTHRLLRWVGSPRRVALCLASAQAAVCLAVIGLSEAGRGPVIFASAVYLVAGIAAIWLLETPRWAAGTSPALERFAAEESAA